MKNIIPWKLIIARLKNEATPEEQFLFENWVSVDNNSVLFAEISQLWDEIRAEASSQNPDVDHYWTIMEERMQGKREKRIPVRQNNFRYIAAAACVAVIFFLSILLINNGTDEWHTFTAVNGKSKVSLPDKSVVWLNSGSTITYPSKFSGNRAVSIDGEASFTVVSDRKHAFTVSTAGVKVKVHGTNFNVKSYPEDEDVTVVLKEGKVSVIVDDNETFISPGEMAVINKHDKSLHIEKTDTNLEFFWAHESVYFKSKSLGHICRYLEKWYNVKIDVDPELAEKQIYTFTIKDDSLEAILRIMAKINPISYSFDENNNVKIRKVKP